LKHLTVKLTNGKVDVKNPIVYLTAEEEDLKNIAQANAKLDDKGNFIN
jgi:DNA-directed RNA polymerase subunit beta